MQTDLSSRRKNSGLTKNSHWRLHPEIGLPAPDLVFSLMSPEKAKNRGGYGEECYERKT